MSRRLVRAALTQTVNAFRGMPARVRDLPRLGGRLEEIRRANLDHHVRLIERARAGGARIVCLGELFSAPYFALGKEPFWRGLAEDARSGPTVVRMIETARRLGIVIIAPIYEKDRRSGRRFNTAVVIDGDGELLGKYRKTHIPCGANEQGEFFETYYYGRGDRFPVFETSVGRVGVMICYDRHFEGVARELARAGARMIFSPAVTFGEKSRRLWEHEFLVDACRHRVYIGGSNRRGAERPWGQKYFGASYFAGPDGKKLPDLSRHPELVISDLDMAALERPDPSGWDLARDARAIGRPGRRERSPRPGGSPLGRCRRRRGGAT